MCSMPRVSECSDGETHPGALRAQRRELRVRECHPMTVSVAEVLAGWVGVRRTSSPQLGINDLKIEIPRAVVTCINVCLFC